MPCVEESNIIKKVEGENQSLWASPMLTQALSTDKYNQCFSINPDDSECV